MQNFCYDSAIWAQTDATHKTAPTNEWVGGLLLQSLSYTAVYLSPSERVRTLVLILTERSTESLGRVFRMEVGPGGLDLTPFARQVCKHPDVEVHFVQINVMLAQRQLPLRLAAAGFPRTPIEDGTCPRISEMQLVAVPPEMRRSTFVLPSGQVLFPFEDSPHITHDGVLLHGRSALQRAIFYRIFLSHSPTIRMSLSQWMGGSARTGQTSRTGGSCSLFPLFTALCFASCTCRPASSNTTNPALAVATKSPHPHP